MIKKFIVFITGLMAFLSGSLSVASKTPVDATPESSLEARVLNVQQALKHHDHTNQGQLYHTDVDIRVAQNWNDWNNNWNDWDNWANY